MLLPAFIFSQTLTAPLSSADVFTSAGWHERHKEKSVKLCGRTSNLWDYGGWHYLAHCLPSVGLVRGQFSSSGLNVGVYVKA